MELIILVDWNNNTKKLNGKSSVFVPPGSNPQNFQNKPNGMGQNANQNMRANLPNVSGSNPTVTANPQDPFMVPINPN